MNREEYRKEREKCEKYRSKYEASLRSEYLEYRKYREWRKLKEKRDKNKEDECEDLLYLDLEY